MEGLQAYWIDNPTEAIKSWEESLRQYPNQASVHLYIGKALISQSKWKEAEVALNKAKQLTPTNKYILEEMGPVLIQLGKIKEAIDVYNQLIEQNPSHPVYYFQLVNLWKQENRDQEVLRVINQLEQLIGITEETTRQKQLIYLKQNQVDKILQASDQLIASEPKEIEYVLQKVQMQLAANRLDEAASTLKKVIQDHPSSGKAYAMLLSILVMQEDVTGLTNWIKQVLPNKNISLEEVTPLIKQALASQKIQNLEVLYEDLKRRIHVGTSPAKEWNLAGYWALALGQWKEGQTFFSQAAKLDPNDVSTWQGLLEADRQDQAFDALIEHADQATTYFPAEPSLWYQLGLGFYSNKQNKEALDALKEGLRIPTSNNRMKAYTFALLGDVHNALKQFAASDLAYEEALKLDPTLAQALNNFSYFSALRKENLDKAEEYSKKLIQLYPQVPGYLDTYAWVLVQKGKWKEALGWLEKATSFPAGVSSTVWEHLGDVYFHEGQTEKAKTAWQKARELGGNAILLNQKLAQ